MKLTVTTRNGDITFETPYTDLEAQVKIRQLVNDGTLTSDFARSLVRGGHPSAKQLAWIHKICVDATKPKVEAVAAMQVPQILAMLNLAAETLKSPKVNLETEGGQRVRLSMSGAQSKYPGTVWITDGAAFGESITYGHIRKNGDLFWKGSIVASVQELLAEFESDPKATAIAYGKRTSNCCFCTKKLTTGESVAVGYGPICAGHYGLPHGEIRVSSTVEVSK